MILFSLEFTKISSKSICTRTFKYLLRFCFHLQSTKFKNAFKTRPEYYSFELHWRMYLRYDKVYHSKDDPWDRYIHLCYRLALNIKFGLLNIYSRTGKAKIHIILTDLEMEMNIRSSKSFYQIRLFLISMSHHFHNPRDIAIHTVYRHILYYIHI